MTTYSRFRCKSVCFGRMPSAAVACATLPVHLQSRLALSAVTAYMEVRNVAD